MRTIISAILLFSLLISCVNSHRTYKSFDSTTRPIAKQVVKVVETYIINQLNEGKITIKKDGTINLTGNGIKYEIDPSQILLGEIDEDTTKDALVSVSVFGKQGQMITKHIIIISKNGGYKVTKTIESDMKVVGIKDRIILGEISEVASDAPGYGCRICKEIVKYQYKGDSLTRIK